MHDVFISYEHESEGVADTIRSMLEDNGIACWFAPRDVEKGTTYARSIIEAIKASSVFVLVLNEGACRSDNVLNEVDKAHNRRKEGLMVIPFKTDGFISEEMEFYVNRIQHIDAFSNPVEQSMELLLQRVKKHLKPVSERAIVERVRNNYVDSADDREEERLRAQIRVLEYFTSDIYDSLVKNRNDLRILDVGCNCGEFIMTVIGGRPEVEKIVGIDISQNVVDSANEKYGRMFHVCDCESESFESALRDIMDERGVEAFDIINLSNVIHHLKSPYRPLRILKRVLAKDGAMMVIDVDDRLMFCHPDPEGMFSRIGDILSSSETSGYRFSGRETHSLLKRIGMRNIKLEWNGMNTVGLPYELKEDVFRTYIELAPIVLSETLDMRPDDRRAREDLDWVTENMDLIEGTFFTEEFMMCMSFMVYVARP